MHVTHMRESVLCDDAEIRVVPRVIASSLLG